MLDTLNTYLGPQSPLKVLPGSKLETRLLIAFGVIVAGISLYALIFFLSDKIYFVGSDSYYYMSIADSVVDSGSLENLTTDPAQALKTPQNGVVFFYAVLSRLGLSPEAQMVTLVFIGYLLHLSGLYALYKIARRVGLDGRVQMAALLGVYAGAFHIYFFQLKPINDGIFNGGAIWLTYLLLVGLQDFPNQGSDGSRFWPVGWKTSLVVTVLLSLVLVHFRLNAVIILGSAVLTAIVTRRFRYGVWTVIFVGIALVSLAALLSLADTSGIASQSGDVVSGVFSNLVTHAKGAVFGAVPSLLFSSGGLPINFMYGVFALALLVGLLVGLRDQEPGIVLISIISAGSILYLVTLTVQPYRYLIYIFPFMYLLILIPRQLRPIGYLFVALVLVGSVHAFYKGFDREPISEYWLYIDEHKISLPEPDPVLISQHPRHPYFFLDKARTFRGELTVDNLTSDKSVFVLGDQDFVAATLDDINELTNSAGYTYQTRNLTPGYQDVDGNTLIQVYGFAPSAK